MVSSSAIISWNEGKRILGEWNDSKEQFCISYENKCPGKSEKFATHKALSCIAPLWDDSSACFMSLPLPLGKNGATAVLVIFMFLLELKDVMRLCGLRIFYHRWAYFQKFLIISLRLIFLILKTNKAFHLAAAKWSIKAIKRLYSSAWWKLSVKWSAA